MARAAEPRRFLVLEQHDGRYLVVCPPFDTSMGWASRAETLIPYEADCRSTTTAYGAVAEYMIESGEYAERPASIEYVRWPAS